MNDRFCSNCGKEIDSNNMFCSSCGTKLNQNSTNNNVVTVANNNVDSSQGDKLGLISLLLYFGASLVFSIITVFLPDEVRNYFSTLVGMCPLAGIVVMIVGRVKYPNNKLLKIVMWVIIASIILGIVLFIVVVIVCYVSCAGLYNGVYGIGG